MNRLDLLTLTVFKGDESKPIRNTPVVRYESKYPQLTCHKDPFPLHSKHRCMHPPNAPESLGKLCEIKKHKIQHYHELTILEKQICASPFS